MEHPRYAFVVNVPPFPNIYLVDMSPNTNLQYHQVQAFEPNVRYCTPVMDIVLQEIQENGPFFKNIGLKFKTIYMKRYVMMQTTQWNSCILLFLLQSYQWN